MKYLVVVDLQEAFITYPIGAKIHRDCLAYIEQHRKNYDAVIALIYENNGSNLNVERLLHYNACKQPQKVSFIADKIIKHAGYVNTSLLDLKSEDEVDIIGFDTDACVLSTAFSVFDIGCNFRILKDLCWSSGGKIMHYTGLAIMERNFGDAVTTSKEV